MLRKLVTAFREMEDQEVGNMGIEGGGGGTTLVPPCAALQTILPTENI